MKQRTLAWWGRFSRKIEDWTTKGTCGMQVPFACIKIERGCYSSFILRLNVVVADLWFFFAEVCAAVDLDDLFFGCFAWVGEAADVFLGVFCHDLEIFWLDAEHT